ncbi:MAG: polysaccharide deacetylase family protein [Candidatus Omnitrophica bacterium]|nr:polysaccharide deacetylase family protein [Candidatus Omnitrophota bacterium]
MKKIGKFFVIILLILPILFAAAFVYLPPPGVVPVLMYHFVGSKENARAEGNYVSRESLDAQMKFLKLFGYHVITMDEFYEMKIGKRKPRSKEILITFDDGNYTFAKDALPILERYQYPVTLFVVSESVQRKVYGSMPLDLVKKLMQLKWINIQSHSKTHPLLTRMNEDQIREEVAGSKKEFEELLNIPIHYFAYPSGDMDERVRRITQESGYRLAFTTAYKKLKGQRETLYSLCRIKIDRTCDNLFIFWVQISGIYQLYKQGWELNKGRLGLVSA